MRKLLASALALPVLGFVTVSALVRRSVLAQVAAVGLVALLVVGTLMIALPTKSTAAYTPTTFDPRSPSAVFWRMPSQLPTMRFETA